MASRSLFCPSTMLNDLRVALRGLVRHRAFTIGAVGLPAALLPARRAARLEPMAALRHE